MDTGELAIIVAVGVGFAANLIALFAFMWMSRSESRSDIRELRSEIREQSDRLGERISEAEREQARLEGANSVLSEALTRHFHTHEPNDAAAD